MGQSVLDGDIDAKPVARTPQDNACLWCPYQAVCRMDTKLGDKMHTIAKLKSDVFWQEIQKEEDQ
jgi:ATP-dependent helicase/nuclease subunit B